MKKMLGNKTAPLLIILLSFQLVQPRGIAETGNLTLPQVKPSASASPTSFARKPPPLVTSDEPTESKVLGNYPGAVLMPINIWGAAGTTGEVYVPKYTNLMKFISLVGGPTQNALIDRIQIKRVSGEKEEIILVDLKGVVEKTGNPPLILQPDDYVIIPAKQPLFNPDILATTGFITAIVGVILLGFTVVDRVSR